MLSPHIKAGPSSAIPNDQSMNLTSSISSVDILDSANYDAQVNVSTDFERLDIYVLLNINKKTLIDPLVTNLYS